MILNKFRKKATVIKLLDLLVVRPIGFAIDYFKYKAMCRRGADDRFQPSLKSLYPCIRDKTLATSFDRHYVFHTAWAARVIAKTRPARHVDISSSLYFCSIVSSFVPVDFYDYRPAELNLSGLHSSHADLAELPFPDGSIQSLSCMHVIEHIGLGRYGDPLNPTGDLGAASELSRVLAVGGNLLVVVPVGESNIYFNAHRVYSYRQVKAMFSDLDLVEFSLIPDDPREGGIIAHATAEQSDRQHYGCGLFWFRKTRPSGC